MYRATGAGKAALPPAMMAMTMLVQGYLRMSDAEMVELTVVYLRVQMVSSLLAGHGARPRRVMTWNEFTSTSTGDVAISAGDWPRRASLAAAPGCVQLG
jgi:hypothetical protein